MVLLDASLWFVSIFLAHSLAIFGTDTITGFGMEKGGKWVMRVDYYGLKAQFHLGFKWIIWATAADFAYRILNIILVKGYWDQYFIKAAFRFTWHANLFCISFLDKMASIQPQAPHFHNIMLLKYFLCYFLPLDFFLPFSRVYSFFFLSAIP